MIFRENNVTFRFSFHNIPTKREKKTLQSRVLLLIRKKRKFEIMLTYFAMAILINITTVIHTIGGSTLTPNEHANLNGYMFCAAAYYDNTILQNICIKAANKWNNGNYDEDDMENVYCREGDSGKVLLDPGTGGNWEYVEDAFVVCPFDTSEAYGRGRTHFDVFKYTEDSDGDWLAEGNYANFLDGIIGNADNINIGV